MREKRTERSDTPFKYRTILCTSGERIVNKLLNHRKSTYLRKGGDEAEYVDLLLNIK